MNSSNSNMQELIMAGTSPSSTTACHNGNSLLMMTDADATYRSSLASSRASFMDPWYPRSFDFKAAGYPQPPQSTALLQSAVNRLKGKDLALEGRKNDIMPPCFNPASNGINLAALNVSPQPSFASYAPYAPSESDAEDPSMFPDISPGLMVSEEVTAYAGRTMLSSACQLLEGTSFSSNHTAYVFGKPTPPSGAHHRCQTTATDSSAARLAQDFRPLHPSLSYSPLLNPASDSQQPYTPVAAHLFSSEGELPTSSIVSSGYASSNPIPNDATAILMNQGVPGGSIHRITGLVPNQLQCTIAPSSPQVKHEELKSNFSFAKASASHFRLPQYSHSSSTLTRSEPNGTTTPTTTQAPKGSSSKASRVRNKPTGKKETFPACEDQRIKMFFLCRWGDCEYICDGLRDFKDHMQEEHCINVGHSRTTNVQCLWKGCVAEPHAHMQEIFRHLCTALKIVVKCTKCGQKVRDENFDLRNHLKRCYKGVPPERDKVDVWEEVLKENGVMSRQK